MLSMKQKLRSKRGASMIMAMVFLLFCMLIGGSVYATATANGTRIEHMTETQQEYYSQRSAMLLMADMLTDKNGKELQVVVTDVTVEREGADPERTISISSPGLPADVPFLQKILLKVVVASYLQEDATLNYFNWISPDDFLTVSASGDIYMACTVDLLDPLVVDYKIHTPDAEGNQDYSLEIDFDAEQSHFALKMDGAVSTGTPKTVTVDDVKTTTTTTVIHWSLPEIQKADYAAENQMGGN